MLHYLNQLDSTRKLCEDDVIMAGQLNVKDTGADFLSKFALHRTAVTTDSIPVAFSESIDFTKSPTATRNAVHFIAKRVSAGTGKIKLVAYVKFTDGPAAINTVWVKHKESALTNPLELIEFTGLLAYEYKFAVSVETGAETFDLFVSANQKLS